MKYFRYFFRQYGETTIGIVNANNEMEAKLFLKRTYSCIDINEIDLTEVKIPQNGTLELYYGT